MRAKGVRKSRNKAYPRSAQQSTNAGFGPLTLSLPFTGRFLSEDAKVVRPPNLPSSLSDQQSGTEIGRWKRAGRHGVPALCRQQPRLFANIRSLWLGRQRRSRHARPLNLHLHPPPNDRLSHGEPTRRSWSIGNVD